MVKIAPSILAADFSRLGEEVRKVEKHADLLHLDVMDGHFVPNITFGPPMVAAIRKVTRLPLDVHLMLAEPDRHIEAFAEAGADILSVHVETAKNLGRTMRLIKEKGKKAAAAINPATQIGGVYEVLDQLDMVLVMSVNPGFGGQKFIESVLPKIRQLREHIDLQGLGTEIEVDGGINKDTAKLASAAGATILVAGSYIYKSRDYAKAIKSLRIK